MVEVTFSTSVTSAEETPTAATPVDLRSSRHLFTNAEQTAIYRRDQYQKTFQEKDNFSWNLSRSSDERRGRCASVLRTWSGLL